MEKHIFNQSMLQFLKTELRFASIVLFGSFAWAYVRTYFGYSTSDFIWEYMVGLLIAYPFISFLNRKYLKL